MNNTATKFVPAENGEKRIELALEGDQTIIKLSSWVDGLGWCGQKTMQVDADMLDEMHRMIGAARVRLRSQRMNECEVPVAMHKVLSFPVTS